ncbi:retrovirus-related pol polyprotein from transposon TNT 1-94 [Tanacetum coccineum]|uniref:Retrovirus-related pol polyprotein from transposon TNT 1-94 n=1 Tax=Tanacetum coccineum TaxID=301880 RepID=A0ABQ5BG48_9ASTR
MVSKKHQERDYEPHFLVSKGFSKVSIDPTLKFDMSMMGELKFFLGIQIHQSPRGIFYKNQAIDQMDISSMVGALMYLTTSRPDIVHATCYCARYQAKPTEKHLTEVKRIFRFNHSGCLDSRKSTSGGIQFLGGDKLVSWSSKKQDCTSMSSAEAEYVSLSACCTQVLWLRTQLTDYGFHFDKIPMYCDSKAAIAISCNPVQHSRTKHIDVRYHFIKEQVEKGIVELFFVGIEYQLADLFSKALSEDSNWPRKSKVTFATGTLNDDALSWWNSYTQPIGIDQANQINWTELKRLLTNKYCPRTEVKKMEDEFYNLAVKGNDLKTYLREIQNSPVPYAQTVPNPRNLGSLSTVDYPKVLKEMLLPRSLKLWRKPST